jgi:acetyl esterase/lipase
MDIWNLPLIHNERSSDAVQHFWKGCLTRSFLANKTNAYNKNVVKFGEHPRQKISVYTPKVKPKRPLKVVMYVHGGVFVNGSEEVFEYLGKIFV